MKLAPYSRPVRSVRILLAFAAISSLLAVVSFVTPRQAMMQAEPSASVVPETTQVVFSNPAGIVCADRTSGMAGSNPGLPPVYPSNINVSGLSGTITKVTVAFQVTSTFPDDVDVLLVGPTGARTLIMSDAGGIEDLAGVGFVWDQSAATFMPDSSGSPVPTGTYRPSNYAGNPTLEQGGADNFPAPGPGLLNYPADLNVFNGTDPNGSWSLFVVDDAVGDSASLPSGWSLNITTGGPCTAAKRPVDMDGDGKTDFQVVRNTSGQMNWFSLTSGGTFVATPWGIPTDLVVPSDYDGDGKGDIAVWRFGPQAFFFILQSGTNTLRVVPFGTSGDQPDVMGDYDGDGKSDPAVYRRGATGGASSFWFYQSSVSGSIIGVNWGLGSDFPVPGDFDGDGKYDLAVQRNIGAGQGGIFRLFSGGGSDTVVFGTSNDLVVPGYYDNDCKQDIATIRNIDGAMNWFILNSADGSFRAVAFGTPATDFPVQGDYDGDGKTDIAVYRNSGTYFWLRSSDGAFAAQNWGLLNDYPTANFNTH